MTAPGTGTPAATAPGRAARAYRAYEAYVLAAPDDLEFPEWDELPAWQQEAIDAAVQAGIEAQPQRVPELGAVAYEAAENAPLRDELAKAEETISDYRGALCAMQDERDSLTGRVAELVTEGNGLRGLLAEVLDRYAPIGDANSHQATISTTQLVKLRERAGLEAS